MASNSMKLWFVTLAVAAGASSRLAHADMGLRSRDFIKVKVLYEGRPLTETGMLAALLEDQPRFHIKKQPQRPGQLVPGVGDRLLTDSALHDWGYSQFEWCVVNDREGVATFSGFQESIGKPTPPPKDVRLAVFLGSTKRLFVTGAVSTPSSYVNYYTADLASDGTGTLTAWSTAHALLDLFLYEKRSEMGLALVATLLVEGTVVAFWAAVLKKSFRRLLLVCLIVNVISLPLVWLVTEWSQLQFGLSRMALAAFLLAEVAALLFEGFGYLRFGHLSFRSAYLLAFVANAASLLSGGCLML